MKISRFATSFLFFLKHQLHLLFVRCNIFGSAELDLDVLFVKSISPERRDMPKPKKSISPHALIIKWRTFEIGASGVGVFALVALGAEAIIARYLGLW